MGPPRQTLAESTSCIRKLFTMSCIPCHPCSDKEIQNLKRAIPKIKVKMLKGSSSNRLLTPAAHPLPDFLSVCAALYSFQPFHGFASQPSISKHEAACSQKTCLKPVSETTTQETSKALKSLQEIVDSQHPTKFHHVSLPQFFGLTSVFCPASWSSQKFLGPGYWLQKSKLHITSQGVLRMVRESLQAANAANAATAQFIRIHSCILLVWTRCASHESCESRESCERCESCESCERCESCESWERCKRCERCECCHRTSKLSQL